MRKFLEMTFRNAALLISGLLLSRSCRPRHLRTSRTPTLPSLRLATAAGSSPTRLPSSSREPGGPTGSPSSSNSSSVSPASMTGWQASSDKNRNLATSLPPASTSLPCQHRNWPPSIHTLMPSHRAFTGHQPTQFPDLSSKSVSSSSISEEQLPLD